LSNDYYLYFIFCLIKRNIDKIIIIDDSTISRKIIERILYVLNIFGKDTKRLKIFTSE
jgi:hypothetical protein